MGPEDRAKTLILWSAYGLGKIVFLRKMAILQDEHLNIDLKVKNVRGFDLTLLCFT